MEMQQTQYEGALRPADGPFKKNPPLGPGGSEPPDGVATPIVSPAVDVENSSDRSEPILLQKTNHVSTVLLYGIPIVSLYIEGQERLCLAQISNTLLKQFSYNEIHNRRVALGITCVQCTPVQLEILRRAGAMPISSRRCGMITRREAERLCKSFLGDNSPPRLPDDFAFSVFHKCAWGCRGSFLPARYNSSRAKCIKCSYCGMFFSPNKFIFHSHRVNVGDKYVQPDAANFNSWRRHMMLSGQPPEQITHAWEDVKAMFNGGTRKRCVGRRASPASPKAAASPPEPPQPGKAAASEAGHELASSPKRPRDPPAVERNNNEPPPKKPAPEGCHSGDPGPPQSPVRHAGPDDMHLMPFSCSLMMDYMWQQHQKQSLQQQQYHQPPQPLTPAKLKPFNGDSFESGLPKSASFAQFPPSPYPWLKSAGPFGSAAALAAASTQLASPTPHHPWLGEGPRKAAIDDLFAGGLYKRPAPLYQRPGGDSAGLPLHPMNASAFKPVLHHGVAKGEAATYSAISMTIATQNIPKIGPLLSTHLVLPRKDSHSTSEEEEDALKQPPEYGDGEGEGEDEDDELVDIETTEEESLVPPFERHAAGEPGTAAWSPPAQRSVPFPESEPMEKAMYPADGGLAPPPPASATTVSQASVDTCEKNTNMYVHLATFDMSSNSSNACSYTRTQSKSESNNTDSSVEIIDELPTDSAADTHTVPTASCATSPDDASDAFDRSRHRRFAGKCGAKKPPLQPQVSGSEFWTIASRLYLQHPFNCAVTTNLVSVQHSSTNQSFQQYLLQQYQDHPHHQHPHHLPHHHQNPVQQESQPEHFYCDPCKRHPNIPADGLPAKKARASDP